MVVMQDRCYTPWGCRGGVISPIILMALPSKHLPSHSHGYATNPAVKVFYCRAALPKPPRSWWWIAWAVVLQRRDVPSPDSLHSWLMLGGASSQPMLAEKSWKYEDRQRGFFNLNSE